MSLHPSHAERDAFVKSLRVGDVVGIYTNTRSGDRWLKTVIERITPKGAFRVGSREGDGVLLFDRHGQRRVGGTWGWYEVLVPWSEDVQSHLGREKLVRSVLFYLDRSVIDNDTVHRMGDDELKKLVMCLRPLRKKDA